MAPTVLWELGASVIPIGVAPDGFNINRDCGSTVPDAFCRAVVEHGADLGIALDGDADRLLLADEHGRLVDGDQILALIARSWSRAGRLAGGGVVATVMSNLGLERLLDRARTCSCTAPAWATATWSSGCARPGSMSAASSPAT